MCSITRSAAVVRDMQQWPCPLWRRITRCLGWSWLVLTLSACSQWPLDRRSVDEAQARTQAQEIVRLQQTLAEQGREIERLEHSLALKEAQIHRLRTQQQDQVKALEETASEAARAEVKLRRFATEADVASHLAEVEVAMEGLRARLEPGREDPLQAIAQRLLDTASTAFQKGEFSRTAELAAQAEQLIDIRLDNESLADAQPISVVPFKIAIPLRTKTDARLRQQPHLDAAILDVLRQTTPVTVRAHQGPWLRVQTEAGTSGWIYGGLLEPR